MSNTKVVFHLIGGETVNQYHVTEDELGRHREALRDADGVIEFFSTYTMGNVIIPVRSIARLDVKVER